MQSDKLDGVIKAIAEGEQTVGFLAILEAKKSGSMAALSEASIGRVYQHVKQADVKSWAILTSWRDEYKQSENMARMKELKGAVRALGLGFFRLKGHWQECQADVPYEECPEDALVSVVEPSLWINGITKQQAITLMKRYKQDSVVFAGPETKGKVSLLFQHGATVDIGKFHPGMVAKAYSQVKGRAFRFEGIEYTANNWTEKLIEERLSE